jgi:perosamine synthetase
MIPVCTPTITDDDRAYVQRALSEGWISSEGPFVQEFEAKFAQYIGAEYGVAVCNGTAAVEAALYAVGVGDGDEVIMPSFTIISCAIAALRLGARPVFVDIDPTNWCMAPSLALAKITSKTRAILAVHMYGHPVDLDPLSAALRGTDIALVEDAAQAHGAEYKSARCGSFGKASAFSFYANKLITTGEGGMVVTSDPNVAERARSYRNLCFNAEERFRHDNVGYNFRMTSLQAALGTSQLARIDAIVERKREIGAMYLEGLSQIPGVRLQIEKEWARTVYWMYGLQLPPELGWTAKALAKALLDRGIGSRPFFRGLHDQPALGRLGLGGSPNEFPISDAAYKYGLYLPSSLSLTDRDIAQITTTVVDLASSPPG